MVARQQDGPASTQRNVVASVQQEGAVSRSSIVRGALSRLGAALTRGSRLVLRPRSIRAKLIRILAFSLVLVLALLGILVSSQIGSFSTANQTKRIVSVALAAQGLVHELQEERALTNGVLGGASEFRAQLGPQRAKTDAALTTLNQTINDPANVDAGAAQVRSALTNLAGLVGIRDSVDSGSAQSSTTFQFYSDAISAINALDLGVDEASDSIVRRGLQALYALGDAKEYIGQEGGLLDAVFAGTVFTSDNYTTFATILGEKQAALADFGVYATQNENDALAGALTTTAATQTEEDEGTAVAGVGGQLPVSVSPTSWGDAITTVINNLRAVQLSVGADITARANTLAGGATRLLVIMGVLAALTIAAMIALVIGAARSVIGPLSQLAREADDVSARRLPDAVAALQTASDAADVPTPAPVAVPEGAASEIAAMADALDRVQGAALTLAGQQALIRHNTTASLANLGRRNQNLVRRQLSLISKFEQEELDPAALSNMFELDHLATRMRRNAESLLVLVGETSPRPSAQPLPVADVIRAALSEVEDYRRVVLRRVDDALISGPVVTEVAHMLAELVENGLMFSPPDVEVEIYGRRTGDRYLLVVVDYGVGMSAPDLARARARLRDEENFLVAPTRFLGHYVVGRLARQLNINVEVGESPVTGITARMLLPAELLIEPAPGTPKSKPLINVAGRGKNGRSQHGQGTGGRGTNGRGVNGSSTNAHSMDAHSMDGRSTDGRSTSGHSTSGRDTSGRDTSGRDTSVRGTNGHGQNEHGLNEYGTNGSATNGHSTNGSGTNQSGRRDGGRDTPANPGSAQWPATHQQSWPSVPIRQLAVPVPGTPTRTEPLVPPAPGRAVNHAAPVERTRNGLVKRQRKDAPPISPREPNIRAGGRTGGASTGGGQHRDRSANEVGGMLSAFSRGHHRGEGHKHSSVPAERGQTGRTNGRPSPLVQEEDSR